MTRDAILEAAAQAFRKKGFHGASMGDIAKAVQLQKASLYHHVSSKQEILVELLDQALLLLTERISAIAQGPGTADQRLREMIRAYLRALTEKPDLSSVMLFEYRSLERKYRIRHQPHRDAFEEIWRGVIEEGVSSHTFRCDDVNMAARVLMGVLNWTLTWYRAEGPLTAEVIADQYASMLLNGLLRR